MEAITWTILIILITAGIIVGILLTFYLLQEKIIFSPIKLPKDYHFPFENVEERNVEVDNGVFLNSLLFKSVSPKGLIFYIHGNADNLRYWGDFAKFFTKRNYDVFMYDFRGFGKSDGKIIGEKSIQRDAKILYLEMKKLYPEERIIIYGFSLGTGIASKLASRNKAKMLILEAPFYHFIDLVKYHKAYLPASWITKYHFRTNRYLRDVESDVHIFHGTNDRKVPYYLGEKLRDINPNTIFYPIKDATHNDMQSMEEFQLLMDKILD